MFKQLITAMVITMTTTAALAAVKGETVEYKTAEGKSMQGYIAYDDAVKTPRAGVVISHDWMGLGDFAKEKARKLASEGYVAFAADIYGKNIRPKNTDEAAKLATHYKDNRPLLQSHIRAAYDTLLASGKADPKRIVVMGYCFGGTTALELARSGAPVAGTVSFHGGLVNPKPENAKNIHGAVLVLHGADDPLVPPTEVKAFETEMKKAGIAYDFVAYPGAVHAFTNPAAGTDNSTGIAYNEGADKASWVEFEKFLKRTVK